MTYEEKEKRSKSKLSTKKRTSRIDDIEADEEVHYHYHSSRNGRRGPEAPSEVHHHYYYEPPKPKKQRSSKPGIAGALLMIAAILGFVASAFMIGSGMFVGGMEDGFEFWGADSGDITGEVTYLNGTPAENVTISIVGEDIMTLTDADGLFVIYNVPTGNQKIEVEKDGYNTIVYKAFISPSESEWEGRHDHNRWESDNDFKFTISEGDQVLERGSYPPWGLISGVMTVCSILILVFSIVALIGGIYAIKRKKFKLALVGAIVGIFTVVGALFSIIALFILLISRDEFRKGQEKEKEYKMD